MPQRGGRFMGRGVGPRLVLSVQLPMASRGTAGSPAPSPRPPTASSRTSSVLLPTPPLGFGSRKRSAHRPQADLRFPLPTSPHPVPRPRPTPPSPSPSQVLLLQEASLDQPVAGVPGHDPPGHEAVGVRVLPGVYMLHRRHIAPCLACHGADFQGKAGRRHFWPVTQMVSVVTAQRCSASVGPRWPSRTGNAWAWPCPNKASSADIVACV